MPKRQAGLPIEPIAQSILLLRGQKVLLDADLAELYGVETKVLLQAVKWSNISPIAVAQLLIGNIMHMWKYLGAPPMSQSVIAHRHVFRISIVLTGQLHRTRLEEDV